ncbi:hypothetical protein PCASD_22481, partial [Puccinia coronata f. sp. avenae]
EPGGRPPKLPGVRAQPLLACCPPPEKDRAEGVRAPSRSPLTRDEFLAIQTAKVQGRRGEGHRALWRGQRPILRRAALDLPIPELPKRRMGLGPAWERITAGDASVDLRHLQAAPR